MFTESLPPYRIRFRRRPSPLIPYLNQLSQKSIKFSCKFARRVETAEIFTPGDLLGEEDEVIAMGYLSYSMNVQTGVVGGMTTIQIVSDHNLENIYPR